MGIRTSKLLPGGTAARTALDETTVGANGRQYGKMFRNTVINAVTDWRVRISLPPNSTFGWRNNSSNGIGLLSPLYNSQGLGADGVVFPYTPQITIVHNARYSEQNLTHSNYKNFYYEGSDVSNIQIQGVFTCQNGAEAGYLMGAIQFLRACTKMHFGKDDPKAGTPPTLVRLSGYGNHYIPGSINCVVTQVSHSMPDDVDYIKYQIAGSYGWMPVHSTLSVTLQPVISRKRQSEKMLLDQFVKGAYLNAGNGTILGTSPSDADGGII